MTSITFSLQSILLFCLILFSLLALRHCIPTAGSRESNLSFLYYLTYIGYILVEIGDRSIRVNTDPVPDQCIPIHEQGNPVARWCCPANLECYDYSRTCRDNCHQ
ncbi:hypothetical protein P3S67_002345 [Capsicum chacoense]